MLYPKSPFLLNPLVEREILKRNSDALANLLEWLCQAPKITTYRVNLLKLTLVQFKTHLEQLVAKKYEIHPRVFEIANLPEVICLGSVTCVENKYENSLKQVVVDTCCGAALLRGAHIYAPGVLAMETGTKKSDLVEIYADLVGKCKKGTNTPYQSAEKMYLGQGKVRMQRYQLYGDNLKPAGIAVEMLTTISGVPTLGDLSDTYAMLQNLPSIVCVRVLSPQPGEYVLDMCAAPGNKTTHIAEMMGDVGTLVALDKTELKVKHILEKIALYGYTCIKAYAHDATSSYSKNATMGLTKDGLPSPPYASKTFQRILLDAPCSALGNRPLLACRLTPKMLLSFPKIQRKLFANAVELLMPGGVLVYSTCTVTEAENEEIVVWALREFPELRLVDAQPKVGGSGLPNLGLTEEQRKLVQRFGPPTTNFLEDIDTIGFFIAKFTKRDVDVHFI